MTLNNQHKYTYLLCYLSVVVGGGEVERRSLPDVQQVPGRVEEERKSGPR